MLWGSAPRPGRGIIPLHPIFGASPQGIMWLCRRSAFALRSHLGLRPKPRASRLARGLFWLDNDAPEKGRHDGA